MPRKKLSDMRRDSVAGEETNTDDFIATGSSEVPETVENVEIEGSQNGERRRTRGRTTLTELYQLPPGERVKVSRNEFGQPIGAEAGVLASYVGIVARNATLLPINHESWRQMPNREVLFRCLRQIFEDGVGKEMERQQELFEKNISRIISIMKRSCKMSPLKCIHTNGKMQLVSALELLADNNKSLLTQPGRRALLV
ncbi:hypothetical protein GQ457_01G022400 [Hibiscus cannabinus]